MDDGDAFLEALKNQGAGTAQCGHAILTLVKEVKRAHCPACRRLIAAGEENGKSRISRLFVDAN